jgi:hypothetical protein
MLVQDTLTGALHEVPDVAGYGGYGYYGEPAETMGEVYDGFGNPVGLLPFLAPFAAKVLPGIAKAIPGIARAIPGVGNLIGRFLPGGAAPPMQQAQQMAQQAAQQMANPLGLPGGFPGMPGFPGMGFRPPLQAPPGWMQPPSLYTGLQPRRRYMRCVSWPGPPGLVPTSAAMTPPGPVPGQAAVVAAATAPFPRRRFRRRR